MNSLEIYLVLINFLAFVIYGIDKFKSKHQLWRIPEKELFLVAIIGGSLGSYLAMQVFHHKTKHKTFTIGIPLILFIQIIIIIKVHLY